MSVLTAWPKPTKEALASFYGKFKLGADGLPTEDWRNTFMTQITTPFPMRLAWEPDVRVNRITCHREVAASLHRVLGSVSAILQELGEEKTRKDGYDIFVSCYEHRTICASHRLSFHSLGAAILFGPLRAPKRIATETDQAIDAAFEAENWRWLGMSEGWGAVGE